MHTKGPWVKWVQHASVFAVNENHLNTPGIFKGYTGIICDCEGDDFPEGEAEGNARLIAAAPDLLEACKEFMRVNESPDFEGIAKFREMCLAAIKKATGE